MRRSHGPFVCPKTSYYVDPHPCTVLHYQQRSRNNIKPWLARHARAWPQTHVQHYTYCTSTRLQHTPCVCMCRSIVSKVIDSYSLAYYTVLDRIHLLVCVHGVAVSSLKGVKSSTFIKFTFFHPRLVHPISYHYQIFTQCLFSNLNNLTSISTDRLTVYLFSQITG